LSQKVAKIKKLLTIPEYFKHYIDEKVDLEETTKVLCPFHEDGKPSFTYSAEKGLWRCWSGPHCGGGDVIKMHQINYNISDRESAINSLVGLLGIVSNEIDFSKQVIKLDVMKNKYFVLQARANKIAKTPEDWLQLDLIMSQRKPDFEMVAALEAYITLKGGVV